MAVLASCFVIENTFVSTLGPDDEARLQRRRNSWPVCSERSFEILGCDATSAEEENEEEEAEMKCRTFSTSTFDGENFDYISMSPCHSSGSSTRSSRSFDGFEAEHPARMMQPLSPFCYQPVQSVQPVQVQQEVAREEEQQQQQQQQQDAEEGDAKSSTKLKSSAQRPSKTTRVKCKAVAQRAIDAAMETGSPDAIQALVNLAGQTPYMRSLLRHALEHFEAIVPEK